MKILLAKAKRLYTVYSTRLAIDFERNFLR